MIAYTNKLREDLLIQIEAIKSDYMPFLQKTERILINTMQVLSQLQEQIITYKFNTDGEEIEFYKYSLPSIMAIYFQYNIIRNIEIGKPVSTIQNQRKHLEQELINIEQFFLYNQDLYRYYRSASSKMDNAYFLRRNNSEFAFDAHFLIIDRSFTTLYSTKFAAIIASEFLKDYINRLILEVDSPNQIIPNKTVQTLKWTDSKTNLIELLYSYFAGGCFNNGRAELKEIVEYHQSMYGIELGNTSRTFQEILRRKTGQTNFIDWLKTKLSQYIDRIESKYFPK